MKTIFGVLSSVLFSIILMFSVQACTEGTAGHSKEGSTTEVAALQPEASEAVPTDRTQNAYEEIRTRHILIFDDEDRKLGLDETLRYSDDNLLLIKKAEESEAGGSFDEADETYKKLASGSAAFQRDPLLLLNWGSVQTKLEIYQEAYEKFKLAKEKADISDAGDKTGLIPDLKIKLHDAMLALKNTLPNKADYRWMKLQLLRDAYDLSKEDIAAGIEYVNTGLEKNLTDGIQRIPVEVLDTMYNMVEGMDYRKAGNDTGSGSIGDICLKLASAYLSTYGVYENIEKINKCISIAETAYENKKENPFLLFVKGLIKQNEGKMEDAVEYVRRAGRIASQNRDISLWLKEFDPDQKLPGKPAFYLTLKQLGLDSGSFDTYYGALWVDDTDILLTVSENIQDSGMRQKLFLLDTGTMEYRLIYEGEFIMLQFVTPDLKYAVFHDKALKVINLATGKVRSISRSEKGYSCSLSPDGKTIAYSDDGIRLFDIESGEKRIIDSGRDDHSPIWYPDGKSLLFVGDLGGKELGDGAGHLQSIFRIDIGSVGKKERIIEEWEGKFHFIRWIKDGEIVHVEEGWDDGFNSTVLYLSQGFKKGFGSANNGELLVYREGDADSFYLVNTRGVISRLDLDGLLLSKYEFGNIWGNGFGIDFIKLKVPVGTDRLVFSYKAVLSDKTGVWLTDADFGNPVLLTVLPGDLQGDGVISPSETNAVFGINGGELLVVELE